MKKKIIKISSFLNGSSSFRIKISKKKNKTKNLKIIFLLKKSAHLKEMTRFWIRIHFFPSADPGSGSASKLNGS